MPANPVHYLTESAAIRRFIEGVAAATQRLNHAYQKRSALESVILSAAIIDAQLRIGIIMKEQLKDGSDQVDESLLHQRNDDKMISERKVMKRALDCDLLNDIGFSALSDLYDQRNRCIHRYIISDVNYDYVTDLVFKYSEAMEKVSEAVHYVERLQVEGGIGIVAAAGDSTEPGYHSAHTEWVNDLARAKDTRPNHDG